MIELNLEDFVQFDWWGDHVTTIHGHVVFLDNKQRLYTTYPDGVPIKIKFDGEELDHITRMNIKDHPQIAKADRIQGAINVDYRYQNVDGTPGLRLQVTRKAGDNIWSFVIGDTVDGGLLRREVSFRAIGVFQLVWDQNDRLVYETRYPFKEWMRNLNYMTKNDLRPDYYSNPDNIRVDNRAEYYGWNEAADEVGATEGATAEAPSLAATGYGPPRNEPVNYDQPTMDVDERSHVVPQEDDFTSDADLSDLTRSVEDFRFR